MAKEVDTGRRFESTFTGKCFIGFVIAFEVSYNTLLHIGPTAELSSWPWLRAKVRDSTDYRLLHCAFVREWFKFNPAMGAHHCWLECDEYRSSQIEGTGGRAPRFDPCVRYCSIRHCTYTVNRKKHQNVFCHIFYKTTPILAKSGTYFAD